MIGRVQQSRQEQTRFGVRLVVDALAPLVLHDISLVIQLFLGHGGQEKAHPVRFEPQGEFQVVAGDIFPVVGAIGVGGAVDPATNALQRVEVLFVVMG